MITPYGPAGAPSAPDAFELHAEEELPQILTYVPSYRTATKTFTVHGSLHAFGATRPNVIVHILAGKVPYDLFMTEVGTAITDSTGNYTFTKRVSQPPQYGFAYIDDYWSTRCTGLIQAPAGCRSWTIDGVGSVIQRVKLTPAPKPKPKKP